MRGLRVPDLPSAAEHRGRRPAPRLRGLLRGLRLSAIAAPGPPPPARRVAELGGLLSRRLWPPRFRAGPSAAVCGRALARRELQGRGRRGAGRAAGRAAAGRRMRRRRAGRAADRRGLARAGHRALGPACARAPAPAASTPSKARWRHVELEPGALGRDRLQPLPRAHLRRRSRPWHGPARRCAPTGWSRSACPTSGAGPAGASAATGSTSTYRATGSISPMRRCEPRSSARAWSRSAPGPHPAPSGLAGSLQYRRMGGLAVEEGPHARPSARSASLALIPAARAEQALGGGRDFLHALARRPAT